MYSIDEAVAEHQEHVAIEGENEHNEHNNHVIRRLPSFRPTMSRAMSRQPSFFEKMFSSRKLNRIASLIDEGEEGEDEDEDGTAKEEKMNEDDEPFADGEDAGDEGDDSDKERKPHDPTDPVSDTKLPDIVKKKPEKHRGMDINELLPEGPKSMPILGKPIVMDRFINRNKMAEIGMNQLMSMVNRDVEISLYDAKHVPICPDHDRVSVTQEISDSMNRVRSQKQIDKRVQNNFTNIQKSLNYRKSSIIIMNSNYSNQTVRKIEPIYTQEARTIINFK